MSPPDCNKTGSYLYFASFSSDSFFYFSTHPCERLHSSQRLLQRHACNNAEKNIAALSLIRNRQYNRFDPAHIDPTMFPVHDIPLAHKDNNATIDSILFHMRLFLYAAVYHNNVLS